jgi:hypothetical protein
VRFKAKSFPHSTPPVVIFTDLFAYTPGNLTGQGPWQASPFSHSLVVVSAGQVISNVAFGSADNAAVGLNPASDFSIEAVVQLDVVADDDNVFTMGVGASPFPPYSGVTVEWLSGSGGAGTVDRIAVRDPSGQVADFGPQAWSTGTPHTLALTSAAGVASVKLDGVLLGSVAWSPSTPGPNVFLQSQTFDATDTVTISRVTVMN